MSFGNKQNDMEENELNLADDFEEESEVSSAKDMDANDLGCDNNTQEVMQIKRDLESYKDRLLRITAEYDNFRKRTEKEKLSTYTNATSKAILAILPVADSLDLAERACEGGSEDYKKGLSLVKSQFSEALKNLGVQPFGAVGEKFNPDIHNAVSHIENEDEDENVISEVFQMGYMLKDRVIRHAMVQVSN